MLPNEEKRNEQIIECHKVTEDRIDFRPKIRNTSVGDAFMRASTMGDARPTRSTVNR